MSLAKTEKAKVMLSRRDGSLGAKERQILIMCNASRQYDELIQLLGADIQPILDGLIRQGLIMDARRGADQQHGAFSQTGTFYSSSFMNSGAPRSDFKPSQPTTLPSKLPQAQAASPASTTPIRSRRSIAASKMYIVNLLQMHRDLDSSTLALNIHTSQDERQLVDCILASVRYICGKAGAAYAQRVIEQLSNTLPEEYVPELQAVVDEYVLQTNGVQVIEI